MTNRSSLSSRIESEALTVSSSLHDNDDSDNSTVEHSEYPEFEWDDIRIGRLLGKGAFSKVKEATFRDRKRYGKRKYAVKFLRNSTLSRDVFTDAAVDLAVEGQLLAHLKHENIIKMYGQGCLANPYKNDRRHFLVLERLDDETLEEVLEDWKWTDLRFLMEHYGKMTVPSQVERIRSIALPIARAMEYLHSNQICFRDLKPQNVGFRRGRPKLFDLGLARKVTSDRKLTRHVGSPLYMAPETMLSLDYGLPVDVYSFSVMLWELLTLEVPYKHVTSKSQLEKAVAHNNVRPVLDYTVGSEQIQELLSCGWDASPDARPTFTTIVKVLEDEVEHEIGSRGRLSLERQYASLQSHASRARAA